jgi:hypothetical protein
MARKKEVKKTTLINNTLYRIYMKATKSATNNNFRSGPALIVPNWAPRLRYLLSAVQVHTHTAILQRTIGPHTS